MSCRVTSFAKKCGYLPEGIDRIYLLDFDDFNGYKFTGDSLSDINDVEAIYRSGDFALLDASGSAQYRQQRSGKICTHTIETFLEDFDADTVRNLRLAVNRRFLVAFRANTGRYHVFGQPGGATLTYELMTQGGSGAAITINCTSLAPLYETYADVVEGKAIYRSRYTPSFDLGATCQLDGTGHNTGFLQASIAPRISIPEGYPIDINGNLVTTFGGSISADKITVGTNIRGWKFTVNTDVPDGDWSDIYPDDDTLFGMFLNGSTPESEDVAALIGGLFSGFFQIIGLSLDTVEDLLLIRYGDWNPDALEFTIPDDKDYIVTSNNLPTGNAERWGFENITSENGGGSKQAIALLDGAMNPDPSRYEVAFNFAPGALVDGQSSLLLSTDSCPGGYLTITPAVIAMSPGDTQIVFQLDSGSAWWVVTAPANANISPSQGSTGTWSVRVFFDTNAAINTVLTFQNADGQTASVTVTRDAYFGAFSNGYSNGFQN